MDAHDSENGKQSTADMTAFVQNLLERMQSKFQTMFDSIIHKIDEMGNRIDGVEQSIEDLRSEMVDEMGYRIDELEESIYDLRSEMVDEIRIDELEQSIDDLRAKMGVTDEPKTGGDGSA